MRKISLCLFFFLIISRELIHLNTLGEAMITQSPELEAPDTRD